HRKYDAPDIDVGDTVLAAVIEEGDYEAVAIVDDNVGPVTHRFAEPNRHPRHIKLRSAPAQGARLVVENLANKTVRRRLLLAPVGGSGNLAGEFGPRHFYHPIKERHLRIQDVCRRSPYGVVRPRTAAGVV